MAPVDRPNEIGAAWKSDRGEYYQVKLDVEKLVGLAGGVLETVTVTMYPNESDNPKAPQFHLKFYPKKGASGEGPPPRRPARSEPDEPLPF